MTDYGEDRTAAGPEPVVKRRKSSAGPPPDENMLHNKRESQQTRTLKACKYCRKQKTRCFKASSVAVSCLRCLGSNKLCSLEEEYTERNPDVNVIRGVPEHLMDKDASTTSFPSLGPGPDLYYPKRQGETDMKQKLDLIYMGVSEILAMMKTKGGPDATDKGQILNSDVKLLLDAASSMKRTPVPGTPGLFMEGPSITPGMNLLRHYGLQLSGLGTPQTSSSQPISRGILLPHDEENDEDPTALMVPSHSYKTSPFSIVSKLVNEIPDPIMSLLNLSTVLKGTRKRFFEVDHDVISSAILTETEAIDLMNDFRSNYGRWVLFPLGVPTDELITRIRKNSSLLLTTCCCLSLRYLLNGKPSPGDVDHYRRKKDTYKLVMRQLVKDLDKSLLKYASFQGSSDNSGDIEFLQAIVILSIYLLSLSSIVASTVDEDTLLEEDLNLRELNLDAWYLSGLGLTTFISKASFGTLFQTAKSLKNGEEFSPNFTILYNHFDTSEYQALTILRIYNHLILIHLVSCVFSGRMCVVDQIRLNYCTSALSLPSATNFDGRMVSEIRILLIAYNYIQLNLSIGSGSKDMNQVEANIQSTKEEIMNWYDDSEYLFTQPTLQFVEFCYNFCYVLIHYNYSYTKLMIHTKLNAGKIPAFLDVFNIENIDNVLESCDKDSLLQMVAHAHHLVSFIGTIENDSYFAYLSDQIHFCFFFGTIILLKILKFLEVSNKLLYLNDIQSEYNVLAESNWKQAFESVNLLLQKYDRVAHGNSEDVITKYKNGLLECIGQLFPSELPQ